MDQASGKSIRRPTTWWWFLVPLLTLGLGTSPMVFVGAARLRSRGHQLAAVGYLAAIIGAVVGVMFTEQGRVGVIDAIVLALFLVSWLGGVAHVALLQTRVRAAGADPATPVQPIDPALAAAQRRSERRQETRQLLMEQPGLAAELQIGRPDVPGRQYDDGGLVDVNHVPAEWLVRALDLDPPLAAEIVDVRDRQGGFAGPDELVVYCDGMTVERLELIRDRLVFVPH